MNQMERIAKLAAAKPEKQPIPRSWSTHSSVPAPRSKQEQEAITKGLREERGREPHQPPRSPPGGIDETCGTHGREGKQFKLVLESNQEPKRWSKKEAPLEVEVEPTAIGQ